MSTPVPVESVSAALAPLAAPVFISDLHLSPAHPRTLARFAVFMREDAPRYRELVILGDLFEFWIGDDTLAQAAPVVQALRAASDAGQRVLLMHGNRDPLLGADFAAATGSTLLADPIVVDVAGTPTLLTHGDAWCTRDVAYQQLRAMLRNPNWQRRVLALPVPERLALARQARMQSDIDKSTKAEDIMDVSPEAVAAGLRAAAVRRVIHGHTHRPAAHAFAFDDAVAERWVLPDWDCDTAPERGGYLDFDADGRPRLVLF